MHFEQSADLVFQGIKLHFLKKLPGWQ